MLSFASLAAPNLRLRYFAIVDLMKEVLWVFGTSASGKETFIKALISDKTLREDLAVDDRKVAASAQSLKNLGKLDGSRASILDEVSELLELNDTVPIKWQYGDTLLRTPDVLYAQLPTVKHRVIRLNVDRGEQIRRLKTKTWWHDEGQEDDFIDNELKLVEGSIKALGLGFTVTELKY